jgi:hypothetical protein
MLSPSPVNSTNKFPVFVPNIRPAQRRPILLIVAPDLRRACNQRLLVKATLDECRPQLAQLRLELVYTAIANQRIAFRAFMFKERGDEGFGCFRDALP